jgi:hypothetical protein
MMTTLQETAGLLLSHVRWRGASQPVSFTRSLSGASNVLVALPPNRADETAARPVLRLLQERVGEERMTIVVLHQAVETTRMFPRARYLQMFAPELTGLRIPRQHVIESVKRGQFDLAVDLCLDFVLPPAYIVRASGARVRIGIPKRGADLFYNFLVHPGPSQSRAGTYERVVHSLEMF